ncbi:unnamed protein product [Schistosoma turkestanicum]|nr:unnamed protein product [Schistosoma turkestanicum]
MHQSSLTPQVAIFVVLSRMAEQYDDGDFDDGVKSKYKAPEKRTLEELKDLDKEDESLQRYKQALLGPALGNFEVPFPDNPSNVVFQKFYILIDGQADIIFDLRGDLSTLKLKPVQIVEGCSYRVQIEFFVQRDIVSGLRFKQWTHKGPIPADKLSVMLGSYGPQSKAHIWTSEPEQAPKDYITWEWCINVTKKSADS